MATEYEVTGFITETSNDSCVVSVTIDGKPRSFSFSKVIFYTFGIKCAGSMTNILEEGMKVELCYSISSPARNPCVRFVWLGDKPDINKSDVPDAVYDQTGQISRYVDSDWFVVETDDYNVLIDKADVFRDGKRVKNCGEVSIGEDVTYDAVPYDDEYGSCYSATCAWIGPTKPRLVDRFNLRLKDEVPEDADFEVAARNGVRGTVAVIPSDAVAIVGVKTESEVVDVLLFRSSFTSKCERIQDAVEVGDSLFMRLRCGHIYPGRRQWIAVSAMKACEEIISENDRVTTDVCNTVCDVTDLNSEGIVSSKLASEDVTETLVTHVGQGCVVAEIEHGVKESLVGSNTVEAVSVCDESNTVETAAVNIGSNIVETAAGDDGSDLVETAVVDDAPQTVETTVVDDGTDTVETAAANGDVTVSNASTDLIDIPIISGALEKAFNRYSNVLYRDPPLSGPVCRFSFDSGCISYENLKIFVDRRNFYIDGVLSTVEQFMECVLPGVNVVNFEALKTHRPDKAWFTHDAICVWVGAKPALSTVAKSLPPPKLELLKKEGEIFFGMATKYHLPRSVLAVILGEPTTVIVDINAFIDPIPPHPSNGVPGECLITNYVKLSEYMRFELQVSPDFPNLLIGCEAHLARFSYSIWQRIKLGLKPSCANVGKSEDAENSADKPVIKPVPDTPEVFNAEPFSIEHKNRAYLINCQGIFAWDGVGFVIHYPFGSIVVNHPVIYDHNGSVTRCMEDDYSRVVCFDAVSSSAESNNFCVERMWVPQISNTRPPAECLLFSEINCPASATFVPKLHHGKITSIPLHDSVIASVKGVPVLVTLEALVTFTEVTGYTSMEDVLSIGDDVALNVEKRNLPGGRTGKFYKAINCWKLSLDGKDVRAIDKIETVEPTIPSWFDVWGFGEYYREDRVLSRNGGYFVEFVSSKRPNLKLCLNLFEKGYVFVDGVLVNQEMFKSFVGSKITFHVSHDHPDSLNDSTSKGMFVACAWIGSEPSPNDVLKVRLSLPKDLVSGGVLCYGVVEDFPLPMHIICRVGVARVLVPLCKVEEHGKLIGVLEENLKRGDRISLRVTGNQVGDYVFLVCKDSLTKPCIMDQSVLRNVTGTVVEIPSPKGVIQAVKSDLKIAFDLCHVRTSGNDCKSVLWLKKQLVVGTQVCFSAVKMKSKTISFRALEVIVLNS